METLMKIAQSLPKPQNWQDFETLCKKLWGEIWDCPEIKKNGRQGQSQNWVDVYGMPKNDNGYYGIQCKGKDEYVHKSFTEKEIEKEIEKAIDFEPKLKKLYFTTTANKDAKIEAFVRKENLKSIEKGLFEIHLFCWEDIVDLIFENQRTHDYYVNSISFKNNHSAEISIIETTFFPKFKKEKITKVGKIQKPYNPRGNNVLDLLGPSFGDNRVKTNNSLNKIQIKLKNTGIKDITNFRIILKFDGDVEDISKDNVKISAKRIVSSSLINIQKEENAVEIIPAKNIVVGDEEFFFEEFYFKTPPHETSIKINWKFLSSNYKNEGEFLINVFPEIIKKESTSETMYYDEIGRVIEKEIEDYWE